jgi:hypothetical protein
MMDSWISVACGRCGHVHTPSKIAIETSRESIIYEIRIYPSKTIIRACNTAPTFCTGISRFIIGTTPAR